MSRGLDETAMMEWHPTGQDLAFGIDSGSTIHPPESPFHGNQRAYFYKETAYEQSIHQVVDVPQYNANYRLEARVLLKNASPTVARAEIDGYGGPALYANVSGTGEWTYVTIDNIYVTTGSVDVGFYVNSPGGTTMLIDDVRLVQQ